MSDSSQCPFCGGCAPITERNVNGAAKILERYYCPDCGNTHYAVYEFSGFLDGDRNPVPGWESPIPRIHTEYERFKHLDRVLSTLGDCNDPIYKADLAEENIFRERRDAE